MVIVRKVSQWKGLAFKGLGIHKMPRDPTIQEAVHTVYNILMALGMLREYTQALKMLSVAFPASFVAQLVCFLIGQPR